MSYKSLYRVYRPQIFDDVYGQKHITDILKNQIIKEQVSHAYLMCGPRGTGKTSTAKIFGNAINCLNPKDGNPCLTCEVCLSVKSDNFMDMTEIDAASNNSVDNVRDLRDKVALLPAIGKYKVYIIDEVHMLSSGAFNALLKTLEEPPAHAVFILATTELRKLPKTILSRCQRYDFKRIGIEDIVDRLRYVAEKTDVKYEEKALNIIATSAGGALRDALSIMDMCIENLSEEGVLNAIGSPNDEKTEGLCDALIGENANDALIITKELTKAGVEPLNILNDIIICMSQRLANETANSYNCLKNLRILEVLIYNQNTIKYSHTPEEALICAVVRASVNSTDVDVKDIELRIKSLENKVEKISGSIVLDQSGALEKLPEAKNVSPKTGESKMPKAEEIPIKTPEPIADVDTNGLLKKLINKMESGAKELVPNIKKVVKVEITGNVLELYAHSEDDVLVEMLLMKAYKEKMDSIIKEITGQNMQLKVVYTKEEDFTKALADIIGEDKIIIK